MPVPKKTARKRPSQAGPSVPGTLDPGTMESFLSALVKGKNDDDALSAAQELVYDAWEQTSRRSRMTLARKALALSPLCADAYNVLAAEAKTPEEAQDLYLRGMAAGEQVLGPDGMTKYSEEFWGFLETRPYMRARYGLAMSLLELGKEDAALDHFRAMLTLNPNDNQGIRYLLLAGLLRRDDLAGARALLASYPDEWSTNWLYTRALLGFLDGAGDARLTRKLVKDALSSNGHVPVILAGTLPPVPPRGGYITMGGPDEATDYVQQFGSGWNAIPGATEWLTSMVAPALPKRRSGKSSARNA